jgi:hypothetical protein
MTTPYALNGHPYVLYYKEYTSFKVNHKYIEWWKLGNDFGIRL